MILDNLIAAGKAKPMIVVMPAGHTSRQLRRRARRTAHRSMDEFAQDFVNDSCPTSRTHYRVIGRPAHRAIAGLSMGGSQTLNVAIPHLDKFAYIGVFSSGFFGIGGARRGQRRHPPDPTWEEQNKATG